jgi:hypothetical protein
MIIHALDPKDIVMATWVDAGHANRPDLSSTKGIFIGCTSMKILQGSLEAVNPFFFGQHQRYQESAGQVHQPKHVRQWTERIKCMQRDFS